MTAGLRIRLASAIAVDAPAGTLQGRDLGSRKARTLLALLAAERGRLVPVDRIVEALWPEDAPTDPAANVSTLVSRTRRLLGDALTSAPGRAYGLVASGAWVVDLDEAAALLDEAADRVASGEHGLAAAGARRALDLLGTAPALLDEGDAEWVRTVRREADALRARARHLLVAALTAVEPTEAVRVADDAVRADPFDERATRDLMTAQVASGRTAAALSSYDLLARRLREELGTDPGSATSELHLAILRDLPVVPSPATRRATAPVLVGREQQLAELERAWTAAGERAGRLLLLEGEAGIGKTRLLDAAAALGARTGGLVLRCRCHPTERSLFLQPWVDALRPALLHASPAAAAELLRDHVDAWLTLLPELTSLVDRTPADVSHDGAPDLQRRRAYDAVAAVLIRLARRSPVLVALDDLQDAGSASIDLLGHLAERLHDSRVLLVGAARTDEDTVTSRLGNRATVLPLQALPASAVHALAAAAGLASRGAAVMERTRGHPLSVAECLRALAAGDEGVPASLGDAVRTRVDRLGDGAREVLGAGSVLGRRLDPQQLAVLTGTAEVSVVRHCEELARVRLLVRSGPTYEFVNDLVQECVHQTLPPALSAAYHRRAADLSTQQPETMAAHAFAAGDLARAAHGWLLAGEAAMRRAAVDDALAIFDRGVAAARAPGMRGRLLLERARAHEARTSFGGALADIDEASRLARDAGDHRLEMAALLARGGDVPIAVGRPMAEIAERLESGLALASGLGDRRAEARFSTRLTVLGASRLLLAPALQRAEAALAKARLAGSAEAVFTALDGLKTVLGYLGDAERLRAVVAELEPELRRRDHAWLLQWAVFDSSFVPAATGDWAAARDRVEEALEVNRRSGYTAYPGYFLAHQGWFDRLAGDREGAVRSGRAALARTSPVDHPWWYATAAGFLAAALLDVGRPAEAADVARAGLASTGPETPEAYRLRCLAPLAAATGSADHLAAALALLDAVDCPPDGAWVVGADCYLLVARACLARDDRAGAERQLDRLRAGTRRHWAPVREQADALLAQISSATS